MSATKTVTDTELLIRWMDQQRNHALTILDGLSDGDLRRSVLPSDWSCLGMIGHLAGLERFWFRQVVLGDPAAPSDIPVSIEWQVPAEIAPETVFASYQARDRHGQ